MTFFTDGTDIDCAWPLNLTHPMNRNMKCRWLCIPGLTGGEYWHNLAAGPVVLPNQYHGLRTTSGVDTYSQAPSFVAGTNRPGGFGHAYLPALTSPNGFFSVGSPASGTSNYSMGLWMYLLSHQSNNDTMLSQEQSGNDFSFLIDGATHKPRMYQGAGNVIGSTVLAIKIWYHLMVTWTALLSGLLSIYVNGVLDGSGTGFTSRNTSVISFGIGIDATFGRLLNAYVDDAFYMERCMTADEVKEFYLNTYNGYPETLNRVEMPALIQSGTSSTGGTGGIRSGGNFLTTGIRTGGRL